jgi:hypothetical protein
MSNLISKERVKEIIESLSITFTAPFDDKIKAYACDKKPLLKAIDIEPASECQRCKELEIELRHEQRQVKAKTELMNQGWNKVKELEGLLRDSKDLIIDQPLEIFEGKTLEQVCDNNIITASDLLSFLNKVGIIKIKQAVGNL